MVSQIFDAQDNLDIIYGKIKNFLDDENFIQTLVYPREFLDKSLPILMSVLEAIPTEKIETSSIQNKVRKIILECFLRLNIYEIKQVQYLVVFNNVLENDNLENVILALKIFYNLHSSPCMSEEFLEKHFNILLSMVNLIFADLSSHDISNTVLSLRCLILLFRYLLKLNISKIHFKKKIDLVIFRCVNFYTVYLDNIKLMEMMNYNKNIEFDIVSSLYELFKVIFETNGFVSRNESFSNTILELMKFAIFYCSSDAFNLRNNLVSVIFKVVCKSKVLFLPKYEDFFNMRFFYCVNEFEYNIRGLFGLTDTLVLYSDKFSTLVFFELLNRTFEIMEASLTFINYEVEQSLLTLNKKISRIQEEQNIEKKLSIDVHFENIKDASTCLLKQISIIFKTKLHRLELVEYINRVFVFLVRTFNDINHVLTILFENQDSVLDKSFHFENNDKNSILNNSKSIFMISSKIFKEIYEKIIAIEKNSTDLALIDYKSEYFFSLFESTLNMIKFFELDDVDTIYIEDTFSIFLIPIDCLFRDLNNMYKYKVLEFACKNIYYFEVVKLMSSEIVNQVCCNADYLEILCRLLTYDFNNSKFSILENNEPLFKKYKIQRQKDSFNFYNIYFTIMINFFCSNTYRISQQEVELLTQSFDLLVHSKEEYLLEILLLCFKSVNSLKESSNMFQNHLIKVWKEYLDIFYEQYNLYRKELYLDLIFSIPINLNFLISEWELLIKPITEAIKIKGEMGAKALDHLSYILDNSKKDTFKNDMELTEMFLQIKKTISDPSLSVYCAQILGKLKSFQKVFVNNTILYEDRSFIRGLIFAENRKILEINKNIEFKKIKNKDNSRDINFDLLGNNTMIDKNKILLDDLIIDIIQFFRGKYIYNEKRSSMKLLKYVRFKFFYKNNLNLDAIDSAFNILSGFIYTILGIQDYEDFKIFEKTNNAMKIIFDKENIVSVLSKKIDTDFYLASLKGKSYLDQVKKTQYLYDSILALFACENTPLHNKAKEFLASIGQICANYWFINTIFPNNIKDRIYFNNVVIIDAFLESFVNNSSTFPDEILHLFLDYIYKLAGSDVDLFNIGILDMVLNQIRHLCYTSLKFKKKAGINALRAVLIWDKLPLEYFMKNVFEFKVFMEFNYDIIDVKRFVSAIEILLKKIHEYLNKLENGQFEHFTKDLILNFTDQNYINNYFSKNIEASNSKNYADLIHSRICNTLMDALISNNKKRRKFSKQILTLYYKQFKERRFLKEQRTTLLLFLLEIDNTNTISDIYSKIDVFVYLFVNFTFLFGRKEATMLIKIFTYALQARNEFKNDGNGNYETDMGILSSKAYRQFYEEVINDKNTIYHMYYQKNLFNTNQEKKYENYLKYMIAFLFLIYCKKPETAKSVFDFMFDTLPGGFIIPIEKLLYMNKDLIIKLLNLKYKDCFSEKLNINTAKKLICIISLLQIQLVEIKSGTLAQEENKFKDEKLVLFIISVFEEFINQREILLFSENPENSIMAKTFELCMIYPHQELLFDKMILYVFPILYEYGKSYVKKIESKLIEYVEKFSHLCYPLIVQNVYNNSLLYLTEILYQKIISFKNYVSNLGIFNNGNVFDVTFFLNNLDLLNYSDIRKGINVLKFIKLIDLPVNAFQVRVALIIFGELKKLAKNTSEIKDFIGFSINSFTPEQFDLLFQIDPLFKIFNTIKVNTLSKIQKQQIRKCLLKSLHKENINSFENLVKLFENDSWMLIDIFVELNYLSANMIDYCTSNLDDLNIRPSLLYYLCHFKPKVEYFTLLLDLSYEEKNYIFISLKKIIESNLIENYEKYENFIISSLKNDQKYKFNFHVIFPLLINYPQILTENICKELFISIFNLLNMKNVICLQTASLLLAAIYNKLNKLFGMEINEHIINELSEISNSKNGSQDYLNNNCRVRAENNISEILKNGSQDNLNNNCHIVDKDKYCNTSENNIFIDQKLINTKIATDLHDFSSGSIRETKFENILRDLYTIYFVNCLSTNVSLHSYSKSNFASQKLPCDLYISNISSKNEKFPILKFKYLLNFQIFILETVNVQNAIICIENEIKLKKDSSYIKQLVSFLFKNRDCKCFNFEISEDLIEYLKDYINLNFYSDYNPVTFFNIIKYYVKNNVKFNVMNVIDFYKVELSQNEVGPMLTLKDNRSALFNRGTVITNSKYYIDKILDLYINGKYTIEEKVFFVRKICLNYSNNNLKLDKAIINLFTLNRKRYFTDEELQTSLVELESEQNQNAEIFNILQKNSNEQNFNILKNSNEQSSNGSQKNSNEQNFNETQKNQSDNFEKIQVESEIFSDKNIFLEEMYQTNNDGNVLSINDFISIILIIFAKFKEGYFILEEEDLLNSVFAFIFESKFLNLPELENFSEIFCLGLTSKDKFIRDNYFKLFDGMLPRDIELRYKKILSLNWSLANEEYIPYIFCRLLLDCLDEFTLSTFRLFEYGAYTHSTFRNYEQKEKKFILTENSYSDFIKNVLSWQNKINKFKLENLREELYEHLYYFKNSNMYILNSFKFNVADCIENMFFIVSALEKKEDFSLLFLKQLNEGKNEYKIKENWISVLDDKIMNCSIDGKYENNVKNNDQKTENNFYNYTKFYEKDKTHSMRFSIDNNYENFSFDENTLKLLKNGPKCWFYILEHTDKSREIYKLLMNKDFYYASLRINSKYPELSQISLYQQLGYFKEAQLLYRDLQKKALNKEISYYPDQFQIICEEAMECSRELQQWDICYSIGKSFKDHVTECDSIFYTSNFNVTAEREIFKKSLHKYFLQEKNLFNQQSNSKNFKKNNSHTKKEKSPICSENSKNFSTEQTSANLKNSSYLKNEKSPNYSKNNFQLNNGKNSSYTKNISHLNNEKNEDLYHRNEIVDPSNIYAINGTKHKFYIKNNQKDFIRMRLYDLFLDLFRDLNISKAVSLISDINDIIQSGPNTKEYNEYYSILFQIIFEMYELSFIFSNQIESPERINNIIYKWEEREPLIENSFSNLLLFVNWRKHAFKKIDDFSNDLKFSASSENLHDITGILNKNKEFTDSSKLIKKSICTNANNGLGKMYLFLGLAAFNKKYFEIAVNYFETVFTLPSIKIVDAYCKVIYELMSYYEMKKYKLGFDLTNSTNILHFTDQQSSNICRTRGMFAEKLGQYNDAKNMYLQAIKMGEIGENYLRYVKLLIKYRHEWETSFNQENKFKMNEHKLNEYNFNEQRIQNNNSHEQRNSRYGNENYFNSNNVFTNNLNSNMNENNYNYNAMSSSSNAMGLSNNIMNMNNNAMSSSSNAMGLSNNIMNMNNNAMNFSSNSLTLNNNAIFANNNTVGQNNNMMSSNNNAPTFNNNTMGKNNGLDNSNNHTFNNSINNNANNNNSFDTGNLINNDFTSNIYNNEILCSILKGLICAELDVARDIMLVFLNFLNEQTIEIDVKLFAGLVHSCNVNIFVFFIYKLLDLYNTRVANRNYIFIIMQKVFKEYPQSIIKLSNDVDFPFVHNSEFDILIKKFTNYAEAIPFKIESELIDMIDYTVNEIINSLNTNKKKSTRSRIKYLLHKFLNSSVMTKIPKNVYLFIQSLNNDIICPYKIMEILIHIKYKVHFLILGSADISQSNFVNFYEEIRFNFDLVMFGSYNEIRNNYKNVVYVESFDHMLGECAKRKDVVNSLYFTGTDGKFYQIQYHMPKEKNYNCNFLWEYCNYKLKTNYELRYREVEIPMFKSQCLSKGKFVNIIERSYHDMKVIYHLYTVPRSEKQLYVEYINFLKINEHECVFDKDNDKDFDEGEEELTEYEKIIKLFKNHFGNDEKSNTKKFCEKKVCNDCNIKEDFEENKWDNKKSDKKISLNSCHNTNCINNNSNTNCINNNSQTSCINNNGNLNGNCINNNNNTSCINNNYKNKQELHQDKAPLEINPTAPDLVDASSVDKLFNTEFKVCQFIPKINNELKLQAYYKILKDVVPSNILKDYMLGAYRDPFSYFQFKCAFTKTYSIHQLMNYLFYTVDISPNNIFIDEYYGNYINRNLYNLKLGNELTEGISTYISPNIQEYIGKEGIEGPLVSIIYHGSKHIKEKEFIEDLIKSCGIKFDVMKKIESLLQKNDKDFNIIKIISEWCNPKRMSKIKVNENPWL